MEFYRNLGINVHRAESRRLEREEEADKMSA